uniref:Pentatricopeptide repeat-containing family protein n=1 Tax=Rhizophora mucronata TaxID=61149 RepID=A0A2P2MXA9_RHIMU
MNWRTQAKQQQLVSQISCILLQRRNWVAMLQSFNLSSKLTPSLFLQILRRTQTHPQISLDFFNWAKSNLGFKPDLQSQCQIILVSLGSGLVQPVRTILDSFVHSHPASVIGEAMIRACRGKSSQSTVLSCLLECYSYNGLFTGGLEIFRKMRCIGCSPSVRACNSLLDVLLREDEIKLAWNSYGAMIRHGVLPDRLTWSLFAQILCKDGKFEMIVKLLNMGFCNSVMYNAVIDYYSKSGNFGGAFDCLNMMRDRKLGPGFSSFSSILDEACKRGNVEVIEAVMDMMMEKGLVPNHSFSECDLIIQKLCDLEKMNAAMMFFKRASDDKIRLQDASYRCMLKGFSKEGKLEEAIGLYGVILEKHIPMRDHTCHAFMDLLCKGEHSEEAFEILRDIIKRGFLPSTSDLSNHFSSLCRKHRWREVEELMNMVLERGLLPDSSCCCFLVQHYCSSRQIDKALAFHDKMEKLHAKLDATTFDRLLDCLVREQRLEEAVKIFYYMKGLDLVTSASFTITIRGLCRAREQRQAMKLHDEMLKMGLKPDKSTYKRLVLEFKQ